MFFGWRWKQDALPYSVIDRGTEVQGPIRSRGVLEVRGHVRGAVIHEGRMVVAPGGVCSGPVRSDDLYLQGEIHGDVTVTGTLRIGNGGQLYGDADCRRLIIDPGGCFVGINRSELEGRAAGPTAAPAGGAPSAVPVSNGAVPSPQPVWASAPAPVEPPAREGTAGTMAPQTVQPVQEQQTIVFRGYMRTKRRLAQEASDTAE